MDDCSVDKKLDILIQAKSKQPKSRLDKQDKGTNRSYGT